MHGFTKVMAGKTSPKARFLKQIALIFASSLTSNSISGNFSNVSEQPIGPNLRGDLNLEDETNTLSRNFSGKLPFLASQ
jgi:hypothetical protein